MKIKRNNNHRQNYIPLEGFYDLNEFDLPDSVFDKFYDVQLFLYNCEKARKKGRYKHMKTEFSKVRELSAQYQQCLFSYPYKTNDE